MSSFILRKYFEEYVTKLLSFCQYFFTNGFKYVDVNYAEQAIFI